MKIKENETWKDRLIVWALKLLLFSIPTLWTMWVGYLFIQLHGEIVQMGEGTWGTWFQLYIVLLFDIKFLRDIFRRNIEDD